LPACRRSSGRSAAARAEPAPGSDPGKLAELMGLLDEFEFWFDIVTP